MRLKKLLEFAKMYEKAEHLFRLMGPDDDGISDDWNEACDQMHVMYEEDLTMAEQQWIDQRLPNWSI